jgi:hypothetical protein
MTTKDNALNDNLCFKYYCKKCDYGTSKKSSFKNHSESKKHNLDDLTTDNNTTLCGKKYTCKNCQKIFNDRAGLWRHTKKCVILINGPTDITDKQLIINLLQQNCELQKSLIEFSKEKTITNNISNVTTNSHNNTFNLNLFLNETCKDALNIDEFVSSIQLQLTDLETTGRVGYVEGISKIVIRNLNNMEQYRRPMHCSDVKREIIYIKDNDEWTKEDIEKPLLTRAIKIIANENIKKISEWKRANPDCVYSDSKKNNMYLNIVSNAMSGSTHDETNKNIGKIISNVSKEVTIDKNV